MSAAMPARLRVLNPGKEVWLERQRAHNKHKDSPGGSMETKPWDHPIWLPVLTEEVGEVARVLCEFELGNINRSVARRDLRGELIQVAAMATAWVSSADGSLGRHLLR